MLQLGNDLPDDMLIVRHPFPSDSPAQLTAPLQRAMARYFLQFKPAADNLYLKLADDINVKKWKGSIITLNYERLLELSIFQKKVSAAWSQGQAPTANVEICFPHGCCNFFVEGIKIGNGVHFMSFGNQINGPITTITRDKVIERHQYITLNAGPSIANKAFRMLRAFFNYLNVEDESIQNPVQILSLRKLWNKEVGKTSWIKKTQTKDWMKACLSLPNDVTRYLLLFVLLNGLRKSEALSLQWNDIDFHHGSFTIKKTKNKKPHSLPITTHALTLLEALKSYRLNDYVFPSSISHSGHLVEPRKSIESINDISGTNITMHDLRRTFTSTATLLDISPYTTKKLLNHSLSNDVTALYIRGDVEDLRKPLQQVQDQLLLLSEITSEQLSTITLHPSLAS